jgi:nucleoside-diphosphate-sugar epimerase
VKVFVTGAGGTLGSYICRELLCAGHDITGYSRGPVRSAEINWMRGDAGNCEDVARGARGHDAIIHLATFRGPVGAPSEQLVASNVGTTTCVLEAAVRSNVPLVVFASSGAALGFTYQKRNISPRYFPVDEMHSCEPQDPYGLSKLLGELTCKSYSDAFGIRTTCLRVNNAWYLDREGAELAIMCGWARGLTVEQLWQSHYAKTLEDMEGDSWPSPGPPSPRNNLWAVIDARDVARAFRQAVEHCLSGHQVLNLNSGETCSFTPTPQLLARYFPGVPLYRPIANFASLISHDKVTRLLGFHPQHTWRQSDFSEWLGARGSENA